MPELKIIEADFGNATSISVITIPPGPSGVEYIEHAVISPRYFAITRARDQEYRIVDRDRANIMGLSYAKAITDSFMRPIDAEALAAYNKLREEPSDAP